MSQWQLIWPCQKADECTIWTVLLHLWPLQWHKDKCEYLGEQPHIYNNCATYYCPVFLTLSITEWWVRRTIEPVNGQKRWCGGPVCPVSSQYGHPHIPLKCFIFRTSALAGRFTVHNSRMALANFLPSGHAMSSPIQWQIHVMPLVLAEPRLIGTWIMHQTTPKARSILQQDWRVSNECYILLLLVLMFVCYPLSLSSTYANF